VIRAYHYDIKLSGNSKQLVSQQKSLMNTAVTTILTRISNSLLEYRTLSVYGKNIKT
jgi:hypothetical protein